VAPAATPETGGLLVADAGDLGGGQMHRSEFLELLRDRICAAAVEVLGAETVDACPQVDYWFGRYWTMEPGRIERAVRRYAPETSGARSAEDYVEPVVARIRRAALVWATTGRLVGIPADVPESLAPSAERGPPLLKRRDDGAGDEDPEGVRAQLLPGLPLEPGVRTRMEAAFGRSFASVRVHADSDAAGTADRLGARAFTVGDDVAFAAGEYRPGSLVGDALIAHELAHTIQQSGGGAAAPRRGEREADAAAAGALLGRAGSVVSGSGLALQRCDWLFGSSPDAGAPDAGDRDAGTVDAGKTPAPPSATTPTPTPATPTPAAVVASVKSLVVTEDLEPAAGPKWDLVKKKLKQRDDQVDDAVKVKHKAADDPILARMQARFADVRTAAANPAFDPKNTAVPGAATLAADLAADTADFRALKRKPKFLPGSIKEFREAISGFAKLRGTLDPERTQWHRLDASFTAPDVLTLLGAITPPIFTAGDVKALVGQETDDLTNVDVAGLAGKTAGEVRHRSNPGFVGIGQFGTAARDEAMAWASSNGVTIAATPDPRLDAALSIKLVAARLGWLADYMNRRLPGTVPTGDELKKLVYAGYNWSPSKLVAAVRALSTTTYTWNDVRPSVPDETKGYVDRIFERLR
jgi:hypothetical protein